MPDSIPLPRRRKRGPLPPAAERVSESEHDDFGDGDALDEQECAIGAENPQRAFDFAPQSNGNLLVTILMS